MEGEAGEEARSAEAAGDERMRRRGQHSRRGVAWRARVWARLGGRGRLGQARAASRTLSAPLSATLAHPAIRETRGSTAHNLPMSLASHVAGHNI